MLSSTLSVLIVCFGITIIFLTCVAMYFLPAIIAFVRKHPHRIAILILDLLAGATGIGWIAAFIWAFIDNPSLKFEDKPTVAKEIKELAELKNQGIITEEEFNTKKDKLLNN